MIPLASAASASYQNVFGIETIPDWVLALSVLLTFIFVPSGFGTLIAGKRKLIRWIGLGMLVTFSVQLFVVGSIIIDQHDARLGHINADLQQKYGATVQKDSAVPSSDDALAKSFKYTLAFADGATGDYTLRFDRATSEPFVVTTPTPDQLEQQGAKK